MSDLNAPIRVLFTGGGGAGTIEVIKALKATGRYFVIAADASEYSAGFPVGDRAYVIPWGVDPAFPGAMRRIIAAERPHFVVPLVDEEIPIVHSLVSDEFPQVKVVAPRREFCELALDKWKMTIALCEAGLSVPATWLASDASHCTYPAIIKPRTGRGSRGFSTLAGPNDLAAYLAATSRPASDYIVQERMGGVEYTTSVVVGLRGPFFACVPKEVKVKKGITQVGVTRDVPAIDELCRSIQERLRADGPFNVQLFVEPDGIPRVIEVNPRYSTTVALTLAAGINEVEVVLRAALGEDVGALAFVPDLMMVRYPAQVYVPESEWTFEDLRSTRGSDQ